MNTPGQIVPRPKLVYSVAEAAQILGIGETKMRIKIRLDNAKVGFVKAFSL